MTHTKIYKEEKINYTPRKINYINNTERLYDNDLETYEIVGLNESDILNNKISYESPMGKALLNKKTNDTVKVEIINPYNVKIIEIN